MKTIVLAFLITTAITLTARSVHADTETANCTLTNVSWNWATTSKVLVLQCNGTTNFFAYTSGAPTSPSPACPNVDVDTVKLWQSTALAAKLAGKTVSIWWNTCASRSGITSIELKP